MKKKIPPEQTKRGRTDIFIAKRNLLILELWKQGYKQKEIAERFGVDKADISYILKKLRKMLNDTEGKIVPYRGNFWKNKKPTSQIHPSINNNE